MARTIVTAGQNAADIDVLACAVGYAELLRYGRIEAQAVIPGAFIMNVTPTVLSWQPDFVRTYENPSPDDRFVLVDFSNIDHVARFVDPKRIVEVYDHRRGFEEYWRDTLGKNAHIEMVGACATLIWEQWKERGHAKEVSKTCARLLATAILSNTLAFKANNTHHRDHAAHEDLLRVAKLPDNWAQQYFAEQRQTLLANLAQLVRTDTKIEKLRSGEEIAMCQIELWSGRDFLKENPTTCITLSQTQVPSNGSSLSPALKKGRTTSLLRKKKPSSACSRRSMYPFPTIRRRLTNYSCARKSPRF